MRTRFADEAKDMKAQDVIGAEVVSFMQANASMRPEDIGLLEDRIRLRLSGGTAAVGAQARQKAMMMKKMNDEWAKLAKFEQEQTVIEEFRRKELEKDVKAKLRNQLDAQMREVEDKKKAEKMRDMAYAREEQKALETWHSEEQEKVERQKAVRERLNQERAAQIQDKEMRQSKALARQKQEETEANEMLQQEHRRVKELEKAKRAAEEERNAKLKAANRAALDHMEAMRIKEMEEDRMYQKLAIETLDQRDRARAAMLDEFQRTQQAKLEACNREAKSRPLKKWMDEGIIERNFAEREALLDMQEEESKRKAAELNLEQRRVLAAQLREKETRKQAMADAEAARYHAFDAALKSSVAQEEFRKVASLSKRSQIRKDLEAQMREKAMRDDNPIMTEVERTINKKLLERVQHQSAPPKSGRSQAA